MNQDSRDFKDGTFEIIGAALEVHKILGPGLLEAVYQEALAIEFTLRGIEFEREVRMPIQYKGRLTEKYYQVDFICKTPDQIIVELKALKQLGDWERAVSINYLKLAQCRVALLLNFGSRSLQHERYVNSKD